MRSPVIPYSILKALIIPFFVVSASVNILCFSFSSARAAQVEDSKCEIVPTMITNMRKSRIGSFNVWDFTYGEEDIKERFSGAIYDEDTKNTIIAGVRYAFEDGPKTLIMNEITPRERIVWEQEHDIKNLHEVVDFLHWDDFFVVLGTLQKDQEGDRGKAVWIGYFDREGTLVKDKTFTLRGSDLVARDLYLLKDNKNMVLALSVHPHNELETSHSMLYWVNKDGRITQKRSFLVGLENQIEAVEEHNDQFLMTAGSIQLENGRKTGWIMQLNHEGGMVWQRQYPRGASAAFTDIKQYDDTHVVVTGLSAPVGEKDPHIAGWVMMADATNGEDIWQRYYRGNYDVYARASLKSSDHQISVLLDVKNVQNDVDDDEDETENSILEENKQDYVQLITLNRRGIGQQSNSYYHGQGSGAFGMIAGQNNSRILYGYSDVEFILENNEPDGIDNNMFNQINPPTVVSRQGWVLAGVGPERYIDPCQTSKASFR